MLAIVFGLGGAILVACVGAGCGRKAPRIPMSGDRISLELKDRELTVAVACDDVSRQYGLMYRESMPEEEGMLFVYGTPRYLGFWMRNTKLPLSIAFLDDDGTIRQIEDMRPNDESKTVSKYRVRYALEVNQGWFQRNGVGLGDSIADFQKKVGPYVKD